MDWRRTARWSVPAVLVAAFHYACVCHWYPLVDDYFIFLRYADNGLAGHGLTFNADGERVEGYTSFLYLALLTGLRAMKLSPEICGRALNAVLFAALPIATAWLAQKLELALAVVVLPFIIATNHPLAVHATGGMESSLLALLILLAISALLHPRSTGSRTVAGILFGAAILTRPESVLVFMVCLLWSLHDDLKPRRVFAAELWMVSGAALLVMPHLIWRRLYYGYWLPNSFYAKTGGPWLERVSEGIVGFHRAVVTGPGLLMVLALIAWVAAPKTRVGWLLVALVAVSGLVLLGEGVDDWVYWWHGSLLALFTALLLGHSVCAIAAKGSLASLHPLMRAVASGGCVLYAIVLIVGLFRHRVFLPERLAVLFILGISSYAILVGARKGFVSFIGVVPAFIGLIRATGYADTRGVPHDLRPVATAIAKFAQPTDTIATGAAGAIPFYTQLFTYDTLGINDVHIAHARLDTLRYGGFAHHRGDGAYILSKRPTLLLPRYDLTVTPEPGPGYEKSFNEMFELPMFVELYEYRTIRLEDGRYLNYYRLRESAR